MHSLLAKYVTMKRFYPLVSSKLSQSSSSSLIATPVEENLNQLEEKPQSSKKQRQGIDLDSLKIDPKERIPIRYFHPNERDEIRKEYPRKGPCQPRYHKFPQRDFSGLKRRFNPKWFVKYRNWLEYSVIEDASYYLCWYLFQDECIHQVDESCDVSRKEQLAIVLRYVNRWGSVVEHFIGIVHVCGQYYDGANNMQEDLHSLKTVIQQESKSAYSIHCFAHQLQLTLVAVSKMYLQVGELVLLVSIVLNIVGGSFKHMDDLRESQAKKVQEALDMVELEISTGLNQEFGLARAADTYRDLRQVHLAVTPVRISDTLRPSGELLPELFCST
nr:uncharacterized protein LOC104098349 [Nicotiana tomentosiformis]